MVFITRSGQMVVKVSVISAIKLADDLEREKDTGFGSQNSFLMGGSGSIRTKEVEGLFLCRQFTFEVD